MTRFTGKYVVRNSGDRLYVRTVSFSDPRGLRRPTIELWTRCQRCAAHLSRDDAHAVAHGDGRRFVVVRLVPRRRLSRASRPEAR